MHKNAPRPAEAVTWTLSLFLFLALASGLGLGCAPEEMEGARPDTEATGSGALAADRSPGAEERIIPVRARPVVSESVAVMAEWPGELRAKRRAELALEVSGVIEARRVEEGQRVAAGQILIEIDKRSLEQRRLEAEAVDRQRGIQLERAEALLARRSITKAQFLDALTARDVATTRLAAVRLEIEKSTLRAPWAGRISRIHAEVGDYANPGRVVIELLDEELEFWAAAPSDDAPFLRASQAAKVWLDAFPGQLFEARIARLGAELDPSSRTLDVVASLKGPALKPGFSGRLQIELRRLEGAILVPLGTVIELGGQRAVYIFQDGRAERRLVRLGPVVGADRVVVEEGLMAGDRLIVEGQRLVSPGQAVDLVGETEPLAAMSSEDGKRQGGESQGGSPE